MLNPGRYNGQGIDDHLFVCFGLLGSAHAVYGVLSNKSHFDLRFMNCSKQAFQSGCTFY